MLSFLLLATVMIVGALGVVTLRQPVHAALSLVGTLLALAVTYVTLQAHFLGVIQVIVYAGAIMVLFLFVIMLLNVQGQARETTFGWLRPAAYGVALLAAIAVAVGAVQNAAPLPEAATVAAALQGGGAAGIGEVLFGDFLLAFHLVGVLLLTGIVGAVSLVQRRAETVKFAPHPEAVAARRGSRPGAAVATREPDDLTRIRGVGPELAGLLNRQGIYTFEQLANLSDSEVRDLDAKLHSFRGRIERDGWLEQARRLAAQRGGAA